LTTKDQLLKALCIRWNAPFPQLAIHEALRASFPDLQELVPPIRLGRLASLRGVTDVLKKNMTCDGVISATSKGSYIIHVNRDQPESRRRFTVAHELGHTFFFDVDPSIRERVRDSNLDTVSRSDPEELLCNYAAAEILMPRKQFASTIQETGPSAEAFVRLSKRFNVSIQASTRRALQLIPLKLVVAQWEYDSAADAYISKWVSGLTGRRGRMRDRLSVHRDDPAFNFFHERNAYRGQVWIALDGPLDGYFVDAIAWNHERTRRLLTTFVLERNPGKAFLDPHIPMVGEAQMLLF
jgi:Zn-dependent peptidase ImmA (M78 family)